MSHNDNEKIVYLSLDSTNGKSFLFRTLDNYFGIPRGHPTHDYKNEILTFLYLQEKNRVFNRELHRRGYIK